MLRVLPHAISAVCLITPPFPRAKSEPDVGRYGVCSRPHSTLNSRKQTGLLKGFNIGMNATILAPKRASE